jgi:hypothetical protein
MVDFENRSGAYVLVREQRKLSKTAICRPPGREYQQTLKHGSRKSAEVSG